MATYEQGKNTILTKNQSLGWAGEREAPASRYDHPARPRFPGERSHRRLRSGRGGAARRLARARSPPRPHNQERGDQDQSQDYEQPHQGIERRREADLLVGRPDVGLHRIVAALDSRSADSLVERKDQREGPGSEDARANKRQFDIDEPAQPVRAAHPRRLEIDRIEGGHGDENNDGREGERPYRLHDGDSDERWRDADELEKERRREAGAHPRDEQRQKHERQDQPGRRQ